MSLGTLTRMVSVECREKQVLLVDKIMQDDKEETATTYHTFKNLITKENRQIWHC